jgi:hypothetical protein
MEHRRHNSVTDAGLLVITKMGKAGRTYYYNGLIHDKVPVYLEREGQPHCYEDKAILCDPKTLQTVGFID